MKRDQLTSVIGIGMLGAAVAFALVVPAPTGVPTLWGADGESAPACELRGIARAAAVLVDFGIEPSGRYAGLVATAIGDDGRPQLAGGGRLVATPAQDSRGRPIAPHLAAGGLHDTETSLTVLLIVGDAMDPSATDEQRRQRLESFGHRVRLIDDQADEETYADAIGESDVVYVSPEACHVEIGDVLDDAPIGVVCENAGFAEHGLELSYATWVQPASELVIDDDEHDITAGFGSGPVAIMETPFGMHRTYGGVAPGALSLARIGSSAKAALLVVETSGGMHDGTRAPARRVRLPWGGAPSIVPRTGRKWAAEGCGTDDAGLDSLGVPLNETGLELMRRAVVWATGSSETGLNCSGRMEGDQAAQLAEAVGDGQIAGAASFGRWFEWTPGETRAGTASVPLYRQPDGTLLFDDRMHPVHLKRGGFLPFDAKPANLSSSSGDQFLFSSHLVAEFVHEEGVGEYLTITTSSDAWIFVDKTLAIDLGGVHGEAEQRIDLDRLCVRDGKTCLLSVFLAQRHKSPARLRVETNLKLRTAGETRVAVR